MISIIIPIFNAEQWLNECLDSIAQQSYLDFEVLMVDDGSRDNSASVCKQYANQDSRFHYFYQQNAGVSAARNKGLAHAKGEWISFVDSDDTIHKDFLLELLNQADRYDAVWCRYSTKQEGLGLANRSYQVLKETLIKDIIFEKGERPQLWSLIYRKSIIDGNKLLFTPGCVRNEDYEFFMKYLAVCVKPILRLGFVGYYYRQNPQSVMHQRRSLSSVIMSIEVSSRVGEVMERIGRIPDKMWLTAFSVTHFLYIMSKEKNKEVYNILHSRYPIKLFVIRSLISGGKRVRCAAFMYLLLRRKLFYRIFSNKCSLCR